MISYLERKLSEFQTYYNENRAHTSLNGDTPLGVATGRTIKRPNLNDFKWSSHCRGLVQFPIVA